MDATRLRSRGDRELAEKLLDDRVVKRVIEELERAQEKSPGGVRRQLLAEIATLYCQRGTRPGLERLLSILAEVHGRLWGDPRAPPFEPERFAGWSFTHFFLQPMDGPHADRNTKLTLAYCLRHPLWRLSLQTHKYLDIP